MKKIPAITILLLANLSLSIPQAFDFYHEQQYIWKDYDYDFVYCLLHDSTEFMWFAERAGLHRYDGYSFKSYYHHEPDTSSLSDNQIITLREGHDKDIWIGTYNGLNQFDRVQERFTRYVNEPDNPNSLYDDFIGAIIEDPEGNLIIKTTTGINFLNKEKKTFLFWEY